MSTSSILSLILLVTPAPLPSASPPSLVEHESGAWVVVHAGQAWVCWEPGPDCFARVVFDDDDRRGADVLDDGLEPVGLAELVAADEDPGAEQWRLGFGGRSLWIEVGERRFRVPPGQRRARSVEEPAPIRLRRPTPADCGPSGTIPAVIGGRLGWREAPRCAAGSVSGSSQVCVAPGGPRLRAPIPIRLRAGIEVASIRGWAVDDDPELDLSVARRRLVGGVRVGFVIELDFDLGRSTADRRARAALARARRTELRELPTIVPGPLAAAELHALTEIVCGAKR